MLLTIRCSLQCAHKLTCVAEGSKCRRLHGHSYQVVIDLDGTPKGDILVDVDVVRSAVMDAFDHYYLNDRFEELGIKGEPTLENFAWAIRFEAEKVIPTDSVSVRRVELTEGDGATAVVGYRRDQYGET